MQGLLGGTRVDLEPLAWTNNGGEYYFDLHSDGDYIEIADSTNNQDYNLLGGCILGHPISHPIKLLLPRLARHFRMMLAILCPILQI